jgi:hypothetical protein
MIRHRHLFACLLLGCTNTSEAERTATSEDGNATAGGGSSDPTTPVPPEPPKVVLPRGVSHIPGLTEVWLDPRASAALTLDATGGVRLWPTLPPASMALDELAPIRLPFTEPTSLSFARVGERAFIIAAIDTVQSARVIRVELDEAGTARMQELFVTPPEDPLLELHVFDGGERLLALGVDHRLSLYDGGGQRIAELAEYGLAPWQLRIAGTPESPQLAMILVGPTRIQRLSIAGDRIAPVGEPRPFTLDRGPNHNDLALLPSGRTAAVFRRPKRRGKQWSLELHDLETGAIRVMWGEVESDIRPRMHIVDEGRALLEDGSDAGFWIDLTGGVVMPAPFELPEELEELPPESRVTPRRVDLPELWPQQRHHTTVVAGLRAVTAGGALIVDPLDAPDHYRLDQAAISGNQFALNHAGNQLAFVESPYELFVEVQSDRLLFAVEECKGKGEVIRGLEFLDDEHLLIVDYVSASICAWRDRKIVSTIDLPSFDRYAVRPFTPGSGELAIGIDGRESSRAVFTNNTLGPLEPLPDADQQHWPQLEENDEFLALDRSGQRYTQRDVNTRDFNIIAPSGQQRTLKISDTPVAIEQFVPNADGTHIAIVHEPAPEDEEYGYGYYHYDPPDTLSMWAIEGDDAKHMWSIPAWTHLNIAWSGDGKRLALALGGGLRVITPDGELVFERKTFDLELERLPDAHAD